MKDRHGLPLSFSSQSSSSLPPNHLHLHLLGLPRHSPWHMILFMPGQHTTPCSLLGGQNSLLPRVQTIPLSIPSPLLTTSYKNLAGSIHTPLPPQHPFTYTHTPSDLLSYHFSPIDFFFLMVAQTHQTTCQGLPTCCFLNLGHLLELSEGLAP